MASGELLLGVNRFQPACDEIPELPIPGEQKSRVTLTPEQEKQQRDYLITFFSHTLQVLIAAGSLGVAVAATLISGGSGLPFTVIVGTALVVAVADACCAYYNYQTVCQQKKSLRTGTDSAAFVVSAMALKCGANLRREYGRYHLFVTVLVLFCASLFCASLYCHVRCRCIFAYSREHRG